MITSLDVQRGTTVPIWDEQERGLVLRGKSFYFVYAFRRRRRWYDIGRVHLEEARKEALRLKGVVRLEKRDPQDEKLKKRRADTFGDLCQQYLRYAEREKRSWRQAKRLINRHLLPNWKNFTSCEITRKDVKELLRGIDSKSVANVVLATASSIFSWAVEEEIIDEHPCLRMPRHKLKSRERVLSDSEIPKFWEAFGNAGEAGRALKVLLLTSQRPGEVAKMRREHIVDGWWELPGPAIPALDWPGTKNKQDHRVWLPLSVRELIGYDSFEGSLETRKGPVFGKLRLPDAMRKICEDLGVAEKVIPHDLRRTNGTTITGLGYSRDAMNRIQNHKEGGIADVYDRYSYAKEDRQMMEHVARHILDLAKERRGKVIRAF